MTVVLTQSFYIPHPDFACEGVLVEAGDGGKEDIVAQVTYLNIISKTLLIEQIKYTLSILLQN